MGAPRAPFLPNADRQQAYRDTALEELLTYVRDCPIIDGYMIRGEGGVTTGVSFTAGQTKSIEHALGRAPVGWYEVQLPDRDGDVCVLEPAYASGVDLTKFIRLRANNAGLCWIWVF